MAEGFFNANVPPGDPSSYQALQMRREIALAMMKRTQRGYPKNLGEGLTAIGDALAERHAMELMENQQAGFDQYNKDHPPPDAATLLNPSTPPAATTGPSADASATVPSRPPIVAADDEADLVPAERTALNSPPLPPPAMPAPAQPAVPPPQAAMPPPAQPAVPPPPPMNDTQSSQLALLRGGGGPDSQPSPFAPTASLDSPDTASDAPPANPLVRDAIARTLVQQTSGPAPPQNPLLATGTVPASLPATPPPDTPAPPQTGIRPAPPDQPPGVQVAQAGGPPPIPYTPPVPMPPPGRVPDQPPSAPMNRAEIEGMRLKQMGIQSGNPFMRDQGEFLIQKGKEARDKQDADNKAGWDAKIQGERERQRMRQEAEQSQELRRQQLTEAQSRAEIVRRTGRTPEEFYPAMDKEKASVDQAINANDMQQLARRAIRDGVITGYGANGMIASAKFAEWAFKNGMQGDLAANTEIMSAALKTGLRQAVETVNGSGPGVSNADVRIAEGIAGSDPQLQMKTIRSIMDRAAEINNMKINRYETKVDQYLSGHPQELNYTTNPRPIAPPDKLKILLDAQQDPTKADTMRSYFDDKYGPGSADLAIARFKRAQRKGG